ncbi:MAG: ABC transporter ATP-binding protein [Lachnospiraceae bacterium]
MHELKLVNIQKSFQGKMALQNINLCFGTGVYGLLGENGAGKTTLMRIICNILKPTQGQVFCDEIEIEEMGGEYRRYLGYLPQNFGFYRDFSAYRFLNYIASLKALPIEYAQNRIDELLKMVDLYEVRNNKLKTFSGGMLRRVGIAQALLNDPQILILDEPTAGLDPSERVRFRNIISSLGKNRIVILSTHIVSDIEYIADEVLIMNQGNIIQMGTAEELMATVRDCVWKCIVDEKKATELNKKYIVSNLRNHEDEVELRIVSKEKPVVDAVLQEQTLEDVYLYYAQIQRGGWHETV